MGEAPRKAGSEPRGDQIDSQASKLAFESELLILTSGGLIRGASRLGFSGVAAGLRGEDDRGMGCRARREERGDIDLERF